MLSRHWKIKELDGQKQKLGYRNIKTYVKFLLEVGREKIIPKILLSFEA